MSYQPWFCRNDQEWNTTAESLKHTLCPHCQQVGTLNRHGFLYGFDDSSPSRKTLRARRVFCSNRRAQPGCGRTFSVWRADSIRRLSLNTARLWRFLQLAVAGSLHAALSAVHCHLSDRTWLRVWKRFSLAQCTIRTALLARCPPPELSPRSPAPPTRQFAAQTLAHLQAAFPDADCPVAAFQHATRSFFV